MNLKALSGGGTTKLTIFCGISICRTLCKAKEDAEAHLIMTEKSVTSRASLGSVGA
jgi:hypothetical protein